MELEKNLESVTRLNRDLKKAIGEDGILGDSEARYLVDTYYMIQEQRKRAANQARALTESGEPNAVIDWLLVNVETLESQIKRALDAHSADELCRDVIGIGPVIAAGLDAHIDISRAPTVGHIWRFAGLDPTVKWEKGCKRPWNAELKTLCWKIGESFVKVSGRSDSYYGAKFKERKEYENNKNEAGDYADQAEAGATRVGRNTEAYKSYSKGKLPPGHIHMRAKRWTVKLFLAHWHHRKYEQAFGVEPPKPYPIAILGHAHELTPPF